MKKIFFLTVLGASLLLASCNSIDSKIDAYEKACKSGDSQEIARTEAEIEKVIDDLTEEQLLRYGKISIAHEQESLIHELNDLKNTIDEYKDLRESYERYR